MKQESDFHQELFLQSVVENLQGVVFRLELFPNHRPIYLSPQVKDYLGFDPEEYYQMGKFVQNHLRSEDEGKWEMVIHRAAHSRNSVVEVLRLLARDKKEKIFRLRANVLETPDGKVFLNGIFYDISSEFAKDHLIQEQERQLELIGRFATLGELSAGIAHEISNPLTSLLMGAERLKVELAQEPLPLEKVKDLAGKIHTNVQRIIKIVQTLKKLSRQTSEESPETVDLNILFEEFLAMTKDKLTGKGVDFQVQVPEKKILLECYPMEVVQVLVNLIYNAADAISGLERRWIRLETEENENFLIFKVIDSGQGIPREIADQIFQPFFTTKPAGKGTGLGLAISKRIMTKNKGDLYLLSSNPNTCFVVCIPKKKTRQAVSFS